MIKHNNKLAGSVKVGEKGQIVIPKEMRDMFDIKPGDTLFLLADSNRGIAIPPKSTFGKIAAAVFDTAKKDKEQ